MAKRFLGLICLITGVTSLVTLTIIGAFYLNWIVGVFVLSIYLIAIGVVLNLKYYD